MKHSAKSLVLGLFIVLFVSVGFAKAEPYHTENSGTYVSQGTPIDTNGDGQTADLYITSGQGSVFGQITSQTVAEWSLSTTVTNCPVGTPVEGTLKSGANVSRTMGGDLIYSVVDSGTLCFDGVVSKITAEGVITGGTGRFSTATGSVSFSGVATPLSGDGAHQFGSVTATTTGEIHR